MKGKCKKCGKLYFGWALTNPVHRICEDCGGEIEIIKENEKVGTKKY